MKKQNKMSLEELTEKIKGKLTVSAMATIEIGELLNEYKKDIEHGGMKEFYTSIGISPTTAQYYMKIARNPKVQKMKKAGKLDGMTMTKILEVTGIKKKSSNNGDGEAGNYDPVSIEDFASQYMKETSRKILRAQYAVLSNRVEELEKELEGFRSKTA